jgi:acetyl esterase/lipase
MANNNITLAEKLGVVPHLAIGLSHGFLRLASRPFTSSDGKPQTAYKDFIYAAFRHLLSNLTLKQEKWLSPSTETVYLNFARDKNFQPDTDVLPSGLKVHWVGNKSADKVFLYFHGGGYVNAISPGHLEWLLELSTDLSKKKSVAAAVVGYTCSPEGQYPLQLEQGTESLIWLMETQGKKPEDVCYPNAPANPFTRRQLTLFSRSLSVETQQVATWLLV